MAGAVIRLTVAVCAQELSAANNDSRYGRGLALSREKYMLKVIAAISIAAVISGCDLIDQPTQRQLVLIEKFEKQANECLLDVRDRSLSYLRSRWCRSVAETHDDLDTLAAGVSGKTLDQWTYEGRMKLWMATTVHNGMYRREDPVYVIW